MNVVLIVVNPLLVALAVGVLYALGRVRGRPFTREQLWDGALVLVLIAVAQEEIWLPQYTFDNRVGPAGLAAAATTATALAQFWRRREPLLVLSAVGAITLIRVWIGGSVTGLGFAAPILVAAYSVGRYHRRLPWPLTGVITAVLVVSPTYISEALDPSGGTSAGFLAFTYLVTAVIWALGRLLLARESATVELTERTQYLERDREDRAREAVREERARIARELHDVVAHNVSVIIVQAQAASAVLRDRPEAARKPLEQIEATAREAMAEMRRLVGIFDEADPYEVGPQPGLAQLPELISRVREAGVEIKFEADGEIDDLPGGLNLAAYRVVQEALTNVVKHAGAKVVSVRIGRTNTALSIRVVDDGRGNPRVDDVGGRGLIGMRQRVALYGGRVDAGSGEGGGFAVNAVIPLGEASA